MIKGSSVFLGSVVLKFRCLTIPMDSESREGCNCIQSYSKIHKSLLWELFAKGRIEAGLRAWK